MRRSTFHLLLGCLTVLLPGARLSAQGTPPWATLVARVVDTLDAPLTSADVVLLGAGISGTSGSDGRVVLRQIAAGRDTLLIRRLGYGPLALSVSFSAGDTVFLDVVLDPVPLALEDVVVTARPGLETFSRRMRTARFSPPNSFYPPEALDTFPPTINVREILLRSGIVKRPFRNGYRLACTRPDPFKRGRPVPVVILLNGAVYPDADDGFFDRQLKDARIRALEIYRSILEAPLDLPAAVSQTGCVVVVWTK